MEANPGSQPPKIETRKNFRVTHEGTLFEMSKWGTGEKGDDYEAVRRPPGVRLIIETEKDGMKALLMTRELRDELGGYDFRLPGGKVFETREEMIEYENSGERILTAAIKAAQKEGKEEVGISGGEYTFLETATDGATVKWDLHYYKVTGAERGEQNLEKSEIGKIEPVVLSAKEIFEKLSKHEIKEGRSADMLWRWLAENGFIEFKNN